jgi:hypothetical protein
MQCILGKIYFWKVFHMNYNWICTPICTKILFLQKVGVTVGSLGASLTVSGGSLRFDLVLLLGTCIGRCKLLPTLLRGAHDMSMPQEKRQ